MSGATAARVFTPGGELSMQAAPAQLEAGRRMAAAGDLVVDFSAVSVADSSALALLLEWTRCARAAGHVLLVRGLPAGLASLSRLYDIDALLVVEGGE